MNNTMRVTSANGIDWLVIDGSGKLVSADWNVVETLAEAHKLGSRDLGTTLATVAMAVREATLRARFPDSSTPISGSVIGEDKQ